MSKVEELIKQKCPEGVEYRTLGSITEVITKGTTPSSVGFDFQAEGVNFIKIESLGPNGLFYMDKVEHISEECNQKLSRSILKENDILFSIAGAIGKITIVPSYILPANTNQALAIIRINSEDVYYKYAYYALQTQDAKAVYEVKKVGAAQPNVSLAVLREIEIPVPPIEIQREIVCILDKFTDMEAGLQAELEARKKQYEYYRDELLTFSFDMDMVTLEKCADIGTGSSNTVDGIEDGIYPFFVRSQKPLTMNTFEYDETATITAGDGVGVGKVFHFVSGKYALHQRAYRIHVTDERINPKFFHHYFVARFPKFIFGNMYEGSVPSIRRPMLNKFEVPIPSMEEQNRIVDILDKFEEYCNNEEKGLPLEIEARHKQYEYYRDKLLTFKRKVV